MVAADGETGRGSRIIKQFPCNIWKNRNERPTVGGVSIRSRNGSVSKRMHGQWSNDSGKQQMSTPPPPPSVATPENNLINRICHMQKSTHKVPKSAHEGSPALHATRLTPHDAAPLVHAMSAWSVKTRRAPSRHCRMRGSYHSNSYGHTTTVMREMSTPPPVRLPPPHPAPRLFISVPSLYGDRLSRTASQWWGLSWENTPP